MKTNLQKFFAWLLVLTMAVGMMPMTALAESQTSSEYTPMESTDAGSSTTLVSAFDAVQKAIDSNVTAAAPIVSISANATQEPIKTGEVFKYNISYTLNNGPTYTLRNGDVAYAYSRYKNVKISITPGNENITLYSEDGVALPKPYVVTVAEANPGNPSFNVSARMTNNGTAPNGTEYDELEVTMSVQMEVTDQNTNETRTMEFTTQNVKVDTSRSKVKNTAANNWWVEKETVGDPEPDGDGHVTFTYRIKAGKHVGEMTSDEENDYNQTGIVNFSSYQLTDTLPTPLGVDGKTKVYPISSTLTVVTPSTKEAVAGATTVTGGDGVTELATTYYRTTTTTGNAREAGDTPMYTEYLVTATYPTANLKLPFGSVGDAQVAFENEAKLSYTLIGSTEPIESTDTATLAYSEQTKAGYIDVQQFLWLPSGSKQMVEFDAFYNSVFPGPAVFEIYYAEDFDQATQKPITGKTPVQTLRITNTYEPMQTVTKGLEPRDYVVVQTAKPTDSGELVDNSGVATNKNWVQVTVTSEQTSEVDFINPVTGFGILSLKKVLVEGAQESPLEGVTFTLTSKTDPDKKHTFTTDATGVGVVKAPAGTYTLTEQVQAGYMEDPNHAAMDVEVKDGEHTDMRGTPIKNYKNAARIVVSKYAVMQTNTNRTYTDAQRKLIHTVSGVGAEGVKNFLFTLERLASADDSATAPANDAAWSAVKGYESFTLGDGSALVIDNMPRVDEDGNYYWYRLSEAESKDASFTKDDYRYIWRFDAEQGDSIACEFYNLLEGTFKFKKIVPLDADYQNLATDASGYTFELFKMENGQEVPVEGALKSTTDGTFSSQALTIYNADGTKIEYYLRENPVPQDMLVRYTNGTDAYGPLTLDDWAKVTDHTTTPVANLKNTGSIKILKLRAGSTTKLEGADFIVYYKQGDLPVYITDEDGKEAKKFTTGKDGVVVIPDLPMGTYYIEEVKAPDLYILKTEPIEVTLETPFQQKTIEVHNELQPYFHIKKTLRRLGYGVDLALGDRAFEFQIYEDVDTGEGIDLQPVKDANGAEIKIKVDKTTGPAKDRTSTVYFSDRVYLEKAGVYYLREISHAADVLPAMYSSTKGITVDGEFYYGAYVLDAFKATTLDIENTLNYGIIQLKKYDARLRWEWGLTGAKFAISATVSKDSGAAAQLANGVTLSSSGKTIKPTVDETSSETNNTYTFALSSLAGSGPMALMGFPVYDGTTPITYSVQEIEAPEGYFMPDDNPPHLVTPANHPYYTVRHNHEIAGEDSMKFYNPPKATVTAKKAFIRRWEDLKGHAIQYPLAGARLGIYRVNGEALEFVKEETTDASGNATFNELYGMAQYVIVELEPPADYELPDGKSVPTNPQDITSTTQLANYNATAIFNLSLIPYEINKQGILTENEANHFTVNEALINYEPYVQLRLIKHDSTNEEILLNRAQFVLYSCSVEDYNNKINGKTLTNEQLKALLTAEDYVYETGTEKNRNGTFLTQVQKSGRVYWFEEIRAPGGYVKITDLIGPIVPEGMTGRDTYVTNGITTIKVPNVKTEDGSGSQTLRYFQIELNKVLVDEAGENRKDLANTTFELYLTKADGSDRVKLTKFTTGLDGDGRVTPYPGRGISISFEFTSLLANYADYIMVIPTTGTDGSVLYNNYSANFVLVEVDYPTDTTPEKLEYSFTITTDATSAASSEMLYDYFTGDNSIVNIHTTKVPVRIRKMGYVVGLGAPTEATATPLEGVQIGIYTNQSCTIQYATALTDKDGFANFTVEPNTDYWFKELTTIEGYELDSKPVAITSPNYHEQQEGYSVIYNKALRKVRLLKLDENGQPLANVKLQVVQGADRVTGSPVILPDGSQLSPDTFTTGADGYTDWIELPAGTYRVIEAGVSLYQKSYFNMLNTTDGRPYPTFIVGDDPEVELTFQNPGLGSLTLTKVDDATTPNPISGISFKVTYKQFSANDLATNAQTTTDSGFTTNLLGVNGLATWTTNANGQIVKTNLIPGWYRLQEMVETVPEDYVALSEPVIIKVTGKLLGADEAIDTTVMVTNARKGHLVIEKAFAQSDVSTLPATASFNIYSDEDCTTQVGDTQVITIDEATRTGKTEPITLVPGEYYIKEVTDANWYARYSVDGADTAWFTNATPINVTVTSNNTTESPVTLSVTNIPAYAKVDVDKVDDNETPAPVVGATFAIYYVNGSTNLYYQNDGTWSAITTNRKVWTTDVNGKMSLEVRLPAARVLAGDVDATAEYIIEELTAPAQYVLAPLTAVQLGVGTSMQLTGETAIVDATGMSITLTKFGKTYENATAQDVLPGARIALYKVTDGSAEFISDADTDASGNVMFANLPKLRGENEYYAIAETITPATHVSGSMTVYVDGVAVEGVSIGDHMLFNVAKDEDAAVNAYNTPRGRLVILKYNYLKPTIAQDVPMLAEFKIERKMEDGTYAAYVPVLYTNRFGEAPLYPDELMWDEGSVAKDSASELYIGTAGSYNGYYFTSYFTDFVVEPGTYRITETASPNLFFHTPKSEPGDPWYPVREVTVGENGETSVCCIANIPNPEAQDISISKTVSLINGAAPTELAGLQGDAWQTITYNIADFTKSSDGQTAIQLRLNLLELRDFEVDFKSAAGANAQGHHYVEEVVVGKADYVYTPIGGTGSNATIYATVYGYRPGESPNVSTGTIVATVDVSAARTVQFEENTYAGFSIMYGTDAKGVLRGLDYGFTADPVQVTMRVRQDSDPTVVPATTIINTARARMTYDIGSVDDVSTSWYTASANSITQEEAAVPRVTLQKTAVKINDAGEPMTAAEGGDFTSVQPGQRLRYTIRVDNVSADAAAVLKDPVIIDMMPELVDFNISRVRVETSDGSTITAEQPTQNGRYIYSKLTGELKPGEYVYMTIDCTVKYSTVTNPSGVVENTAYVISLYELPMNVDNPTGVSFTDENGNLPAHEVVLGEAGTPNAKVYMALRATMQHTLSQTSMLQLYKMVSAEQSGKGIEDFIGQEGYAVSLVDGEIRYRIILVNGGDTEITNIRIMDKLPIAGDTQIGMPIARNSVWRTRFDDLVSVTLQRSGSDSQNIDSGNYTLWSTTTQESGSSYVDVLRGLSTTGWSTGANADSLAIMLAFDDTIVLDPGEWITVEFKTKAPSAQEAQNAYFRMAVNNAYSTYDVVNSTAEPGLINSPDTRVTLMPAMVSLGNRVWVDKNANGIQDFADGEDYDSPSGTVALEHALRESGMSIQLHTFINNDSSSSTQSTGVVNGFYAFTNLSPAALIPDEADVAYESNGDIKNSSLLGTARTTYQLELQNIPDGYLVTRPYQLSGGTVPNYEGNTGDARAKDSNFRLRDGSYKSEKFYLKANIENDTTFDVGLIRIRDLEVEKKGTDGRNIRGVTFAIYGPYTSEELQGVTRSGLVITADKLVDTISTGSDGKAKFTSTESKFLNYYSNYVVVETGSADNYLADQLVATGEGIGTPNDYPTMSGEGIISGKNYFVLKQESTTTKVQAVKATNEYVAEGNLLLSGTKTFTGGDIATTPFEFVLTSTGANADPDFPSAGLTATTDATGAFVFSSIDYDFADAGETYVYTMAETNAGAAGVQYDTNVYTITVAITDNGNGKLTVDPTITDLAGSPVKDIVFENEGTGSVTVTKVAAGNGKAAVSAFDFTVKLTDAGGANLTGDVAYKYSDQAATTATLDEFGVFTLSLVDGQSFTVLDLPTGTQYAITEDNYTMQGYTTAVTAAMGGTVEADNPRNVTGKIAQGAVHTFTYTNTRNVGDLTISKIVAGNAGDEKKDFRFVITLRDTQNFDLGKTYPCTGVDGLTDVTFTSDPIANNTFVSEPILLKDGQSLTIQGIEAGTTFTVTEDSYRDEGYITTPAGGVISGTIATATVSTAAFTNTRNVNNITINKNLAGNAALQSDKFSITLTLRENGTKLADSYMVVSNDPDICTDEGTSVSVPVVKTQQDATTGTMTFSLGGNKYVTVLGLPCGTGFDVTETLDEQSGYKQSPITFNVEATATGRELPLGQPATVTITNTKNTYGGLNISKAVIGNAGDSQKLFTFELELKRNDGLTVDGDYDECELVDWSTTPETKTKSTRTVNGGKLQFTLTDKQSLYIPGILTGTEYEVRETDYTSDGYTTRAENASGTITDQNESYTAAFTNERNVGDLLVNKIVTGNGGIQGDEFEFTLSLMPRQDGADLADTYNTELTDANGDVTNGTIAMVKDEQGVSKGTFKLLDGQQIKIIGILAGTEYEVTETDYASRGYGTSIRGASKDKITSNRTNPMSVTFENTRDVGNLTVTKTLEGNATDPNKDFTFTVHLYRADSVPVSGEYSYEVYTRNENSWIPVGDGTARTLTVDASGNTELTLQGGQRATIKGILKGTNYEVTEVRANQDGYTTTQTGETGTIDVADLDANGNTAVGNEAAFTNTRNTGTLTVRKTLTGNATEATRAFNFTVVINDPSGVGYDGELTTTGARTSLTFTNGMARFTLMGGQSLTITDLLAGSIYSVTETDANQNGYTTTMTGATGTIRTNEEAVASCVNSRSVTQTYTSLSATKTWDDGNNADGLRPTSITVYLYRNNQVVDSRVMTEATGWTTSFNNLPVYDDVGDRYRYRIVEVATAEYYATYDVQGTVTYITNGHNFERFTVLEDAMVPLGGNINMNEGDCFN